MDGPPLKEGSEPQEFSKLAVEANLQITTSINHSDSGQ